MKRTLLTATAASLTSMLLLGCSHQLMQPTAEPQTAPNDATRALEPTETAASQTASPVHWQRPGDFVVYRFSGSYRDAPLTLTRRLLSRDGEATVVDVTLDDGTEQKHLRLRVRQTPEGHAELSSVARLENGVQQPFGIAAYEALMAEAMLTADDNEGLIAETATEVKVGSKAVACTKSSYRVRVGELQATMITFESEQFPWGDLGGQIVAADGTLLYDAHVVASGSANEPAETIAAYEDDAYDEID